MCSELSSHVNEDDAIYGVQRSIMAKQRGALRKGRAVDGKLNSHLQWPYNSEMLRTKVLTTSMFQHSLHDGDHDSVFRICGSILSITRSD